MQNKTTVTQIFPHDYLATVGHPTRRGDALTLLDLFQEVTGWSPAMWGPSIVGFGAYYYRYKTGHDGTFLATGFAPRATNLSIYIMPGYQNYSHILQNLGKHKLGKSCLYINKLADVDLDVLKTLIRTGVEDLNKIWTVYPSLADLDKQRDL